MRVSLVDRQVEHLDRFGADLLDPFLRWVFLQHLRDPNVHAQGEGAIADRDAKCHGVRRIGCL
jgi:hypothetical protein